jgi:ADP-heptose:LPS heptosyltransferase
VKLKTKIVIDKLVGQPIVYLLNFIARLLGKLLGIDHSLTGPIKEIAVCKFLGLGSIIQTTPLLQTLRANFPDAKITFVTTKGNQAIFDYIKEVDCVYCISDKNIFSLIGSTVSILFKFWRKRPDVYIDLEIYSNFSSAFTTLSLAKDRLGYFKNDKNYRKGIYTHLQYYNTLAPISQSYLQFARLLKVKTIIDALKLSLDTNASKLSFDLQTPHIIVNPNASDLRLERRWDMNNFVQLIDEIIKYSPNIKIVLIGSANESIYVNTLYEKIIDKKNCINTSGQLSLAELLGLIQNAKLMITNDTGPMHMAFAIGTPTISLFGPCSPQQYGSQSLGIKNNVSFYKKLYCSPCVHDFIVPPCKGDNQCMKKIMVNEVFLQVKKIIDSNFIIAAETILDNSIDYIGLDEKPLGLIS